MKIDVTDKSLDRHSGSNRENAESRLQPSAATAFTKPKPSIYPLVLSDECGRMFNFVGDVKIDVTDKSLDRHSGSNRENAESRLQPSEATAFTKPKPSIYPLVLSDECGRMFNFVGDVKIGFDFCPPRGSEVV